MDSPEDFNATTAALFLAAAGSAFMEQFGTTDFVCTVPVNTRAKQDRHSVGCFINLMPLRLSWSQDASPAERVSAARTALVHLLVHRRAPGIVVIEDPRLVESEHFEAPVVLIQGAEITEIEVLGHRVVIDDGNGTREELGLTIRLIEGDHPHLAVDHDAGRFVADVARSLAEATRRWLIRLGEEPQ
jgi:non-ribosomal peptide synthetase component F